MSRQSPHTFTYASLKALAEEVLQESKLHYDIAKAEKRLYKEGGVFCQPVSIKIQSL